MLVLIKERLQQVLVRRHQHPPLVISEKATRFEDLINGVRQDLRVNGQRPRPREVIRIAIEAENYWAD